MLLTDEFKKKQRRKKKKQVKLVNSPELQMRGSIEDKSKIIFLISQQNIHCDPSSEPSQ